MFKKYREVYKVLERRWQTVHGFSFRDFSGWNAAQQSYITRFRPLWLIIEDRATMQRIWVTHEGRDMRITYAAMDDQGRNCGESHHIRCNSKTQLAQELEGLFSRLDVAA